MILLTFFYNFGIYRNPILITEIQLYYQVYHDVKIVNKITIIPKYSSKLGHIICLYII